MRKIIIPSALLLTAILATGANAAAKGSADVVKVTPVQTAVTAPGGERVDLGLRVDIDRSWHLYAHGDTLFIGVDLVPDDGFPLGQFDAAYPEGHEIEFFGEKVLVLEGANRIEASALVPADLPAGEHRLALKLRVQACDDKMCLAPAKIPVEITLTVP